MDIQTKRPQVIEVPKDVFEGVAITVPTGPGWLLISPDQRNELIALLGGSLIKDGADLVSKLKRSQEVRTPEGFNLILTTEDLWALKQQAIGMSRPYEEYVKEFVQDAVAIQLNGFVGRR